MNAAPDVFAVDDDGLVVVLVEEVSFEDDLVVDALAMCPVQALRLES